MAIEGKNDGAGGRRIRLGMVGGGEGAFIGAVHRIAARLDDHYTLVAGALSSTPEKAMRSGAALGLDPRRTYGSFEEMAARERRLKDGIEAVAIVTPNHMHAPGGDGLPEGRHPRDLRQAADDDAEGGEEARGARREVGRRSSPSPTTTPATRSIRQARDMVQAGELGEIRVVQVEYPQDWLTEKLEDSGQKQADWRTDPARSGARRLHRRHRHARLQPRRLRDRARGRRSSAPSCTTFVPGRKLDDNVQIMLRYANGARGIAVGQPGGAGQRERPAAARLRHQGRHPLAAGQPELPLLHAASASRRRSSRAAGAGANAAAARVSRIPSRASRGLPGRLRDHLQRGRRGDPGRPRRARKPAAEVTFPTVEDGVKGVAFIEAAVRSSQKKGAWTAL